MFLGVYLKKMRYPCLSITSLLTLAFQFRCSCSLNLYKTAEKIAKIETFHINSDIKSFKFILEEDWFQNVNITESCYSDWNLIRYYNFSDTFKFWDSWAIPGTGLAAGHVLYLGQSEECMNAKTGYFAVGVTEFPETGPYLTSVIFTNQSSFNLAIMVCMPVSCSNQDAAEVLKLAFNSSDEAYPSIEAFGRYEADTDAAFVIAVIVFGSLVALVILATSVSIANTLVQNYKQATLIDQSFTMFQNEKPEEETELDRSQMGSVVESHHPENTKPSFVYQLLMCFDFCANMGKIMKMPTEKDPNQLSVLNGMRVMSLGWVILGHLLVHEVAIVDNALYILLRGRSFLMQTLTNATPSVDTFFVMSGLLIMIGTMNRSLDKKRDDLDVKYWAVYYVHRLIRLWPPLLFTLLFVVGIYPMLPRLFYSPLFQPDTPSSLPSSCGDSRWASAAFFYNNLLEDSPVTCLDWSWYVSCDVQLFLITPFLILLTRKNRRLGVAAVLTLLLASTLIIIIASAVENIPPALGLPLLADAELLYSEYNMQSAWNTRIYMSPYTRYQTYGIGLLLGLAIYEQKKLEDFIKSYSVNQRIIAACSVWLAAFILGGVAVYGCYPSVNNHPMGRVASAFYNGSFRVLWGVAVSAVILLCTLGYGGLVNDILSSNLWIPLARANYTTYMIHYVCLDLFAQTIQETLHFTTIDFTLLAAGILLCVNFLGPILSCFIEAPFMQVEKLVLGQRR